MLEVNNPRDKCEKVYTLIQVLMTQLKSIFAEQGDCKSNACRYYPARLMLGYGRSKVVFVHR